MNKYKEWILTDYIVKNYIGGSTLVSDYKFRRDVKKSLRFKLYRIKKFFGLI